MNSLEKHKIDKFRTRNQRGFLKFRILIIGSLFLCYVVIANFISPPKPKLRESAGNVQVHTHTLLFTIIFHSLSFSFIISKSSTENDFYLWNFTGRSLLAYNDDSNCTPPAINEFPPDFFTPEQRKNGAIVFHFVLACYLFILLAFVCDDYFVPSIKTLCDSKCKKFYVN